MSKIKKIGWLLLVVCGGGWLLSLTQVTQSLAAPEAAEEVVPDGTLVVALSEIPANLYLYDTLTQEKQDILTAIFDGPIQSINGDYQSSMIDPLPTTQNNLVQIRAVEVMTGSIVVDAAENIVTLAGGEEVINSAGQTVVFDGSPLLMNQMVVTFTLKPDLMWSDGTPLTPADLVFGFNVACDHGSFNCDRIESYVGLPEPETGVVLVSVPGFFDPHYLEIFWPPLPEHLLEGIPPAEIVTSTYALQPIGWGPYQVEEFVPGEKVVLGRNPYYSNPTLPQIDTIIFEEYTNPELAYHDLIAGEVHLIHPFLVDLTALATFREAQDQGAIQPHNAPSLVTEYLHFGINPADTRYRFFEDVEVRQAIALCTNRQAINESVFAGLSGFSHSYVVNGSYLTAGADLTEWLYNPSEGQAKLTAAGWLVNNSDGWRYKEGQKFAINYKTTNNPLRQTIGQLFQADMAECGIEVTLEFLSTSEFFADGPTGPVFGRQFDVVQFALAPDANDGSLGCHNFLTSHIPDNNNSWQGFNVYGYSNANFDSACEDGLSQFWGAPEYVSAHQAALELWSNELPALPLVSRVNTVLSNPNLHGLQFLTIQDGLLWNVEEWYFTAENEVEADAAGQLVSLDGLATLDTPAGAFTDTALLQYTPWLPTSQTGLVNSGRTFMLSAIDNTGNPLTFNSELTATLTITYNHYSLAVLDSFAPGLGLYYWDGSQWVLEPTSTIDLENQTVTAHINRLGVWALLSESNNQPVYLPLVLTP
jgi:peptide/nickel transport system substrate-binding protein